MAVTSSVRPSRELPWLVLSGLLVMAVCWPLWWYWHMPSDAERVIPGLGLVIKRVDVVPALGLTVDRLGRLLIGPEQIACYVACVWALLILFGRKWEVSRQRKAFRLELLPTDEGARILPEDARPLLRKMEQAVGRQPFILATMVRLGLGKYAVSRSAPDVGEVVRSQAEVELGRFVTGLNLVHYLAWAIPAIGFLGTVRGLSMTMSLAGVTGEELGAFLQQATTHLNVAFDCTLVALGLSVIVMYFLHTVQRDEEMLVIDCQQYCQEHLLLRLYNPQPEAAGAEA